MMSGKALLVVSAGLFIAWIGWLVYLVAQTRDPVILSRPQFLMADLYVTAWLTAEDGKPSATATVDEVLWAAPGRAKPAKGTPITVANVHESGSRHWRGAGLYLLPLTQTALPATYLLTPVPPSPGYRLTDRLRIYLATRDTLHQVRELIAAKTE